MKISKFGVHIKASDVEASKDFYLKFNFKPIFAYGSEKWIESLKVINNDMGSAPEKYNGVTFDVGGSLFELGEKHIAVKQEVFKETIPSSKVSAMIDVDSVEEIQQICEENNLKISVPITKYPWGTKEIVIKDPDGFVLVFREVSYM